MRAGTPSGAEARLAHLGIQLPELVAPRATIVTARRVGDLVYLSGRGPTGSPDGRMFVGKVGEDLDLAEAKQAARVVGLNLLAAIRAELGSLDEVVACAKVFGIVNCAPGFTQIGDVIDGCSELLLEVFGEAIGKHARTTINAAEMPNHYPVAIDLIVAAMPLTAEAR
jgi:enamine deaminase RidA (YjgF/YER057c/UK114 family)